MDKLVGQRLGPYRLLARVRSDGVTTVYKAHEPSTDRPVAITLLSASLAQERTFGERLQREARTLAQPRHAHIVPFHDHDQIDGRPYLVTGYVEGRTLRERLREGPLALMETNRIIGQVGAALDYAHQLGIAHGDVRPGNVLLDAEGRAFLTNFGLASIIESGGAPGWLGIGVGAPAYVSPEQGRGQPADARSDVYSLGVMLYRMTTGRLPHEAGTPLGTVLQHIDQLPPLPRTVRPDLPQDVEQVILRAMAPEPDHRFQGAGEMVRALDEAVQAAEPLPGGVGRWIPSRRAGQGPTRRLGFGWVPSVGWSVLGSVVGGILLLLLIFALARLPVRVRVEGGQVAVVRVIEQTATPAAAVGAARPTSTATPEPTAVLTPTPTPTATPRPYVTATPLAFATNTPLPPVINEEARAFAEPILTAIADRPPDFSDDFAPGDPEWAWETTDVALDDVDYGFVDGVAWMELVDEGTIKLRHPGLAITDFVLSVESRQVAGTSGSEQQVFLHFAETYFNITLEGGTRRLWAGVPWHPGGSIDGEGGVIHPMGEANHTLLVVSGEQLAVYLNDVPVLYLEEPKLHASHRISFWCHGVPDVACEFDNVQLWKLEE